jgi:hypothetical protein
MAQQRRGSERRPARIGGVLAAGLLAVLLLPACGDDAPEQRLEAASEALSDARADADQAREQLAERERKATEELQEARSALREAESELLSAQQLMERRATDVALFRAVQAAMLDAPQLQTAAVEVRVDDGVVTLAGVVQDAEARQRALELARETAGVRDVRDQLDVVEEPLESKATAEAGPS